jgi:hypothetical protein
LRFRRPAIITPGTSPNAAILNVLISSFRVKICVIGSKHFGGSKDVSADARVVVTDAAMD